MALKDTWKNKVNGEDDVDASDINDVAQAVINIENDLGRKEDEITLSDKMPLVDGEASPGVSNEVSRTDHVHPTDESRMPSAESMGGIAELDLTDSFIVYDVPGKEHKILAWRTFVGIIEKILNERLNIVSSAVADTETGYTATLPELEDDAVLALRSDIPSIPVQSVNGKTGAVQLDAADVGAAPSDKTITITGVDENGATHTWTAYGVKV